MTYVGVTTNRGFSIRRVCALRCEKATSVRGHNGFLLLKLESVVWSHCPVSNQVATRIEKFSAKI